MYFESYLISGNKTLQIIVNILLNRMKNKVGNQKWKLFKTPFNETW